MELQQLEYLVAAAKAGSFSRAARDCFTSRQNIAHSVKGLESELGVLLFTRGGGVNNNILTANGRKAVDKAQTILRHVREMEEMFGAEDVPKAKVTLAVSRNMFAGMSYETEEYLASLVDEIKVVELDCRECYEGLCARRIDLAFVMCMEHDFPNCKSIELENSTAYLLVNEESSFASMDSIAVEDIVGVRIYLMSDPLFQYVPLMHALREKGGLVSDCAVAASTATVMQLIRGNSGVGVVSSRFAAHPPNGLKAIPIADPRVSWRFYLLGPSGVLENPRVGKIAEGIKRSFSGTYRSKSDSN